MTQQELNEKLELHKKWLNNESDGKKLNLSRMDLNGINLNGMDLSFAILRYADLQNADLRDADLQYAKLENAILRYVNLENTILRYANLQYADLRGAELQDVDLYGAILDNTFMDETTKINYPMACPETGSFIGYKKACECSNHYPCIVKLEIPSDAKRSSSTTEKCRCSKAKVLKITDMDGNVMGDMGDGFVAYSRYDVNFAYKTGEMVEALDFDECRWNECASGIHFFMDEEDAKWY